MSRCEVTILTVLLAGLIAGCSTDPPKVNCERHLTPINGARTLAPQPSGSTPGAGGASSKTPSTKAPPHGR